MKTKLKAIQDDIQNVNPGHVVVGKDVLELLSSGMYVNQLTIYREFIQNSIDSIEEAKFSRPIKNIKGKININLGIDNRSITIIDNGIGVKNNDFYRLMTSIGASHKKGTNARGFRGVGRLSGLGCCRELVFRSKFYGEELISELRWDCQKLKAHLRDCSNNMELEDVIHDSASFTVTKTKDKKEHYFEVQLNGVNRLRMDALINEKLITEYISQVAPIPFSPEFTWADEIKSSLDVYNCLSEVDIYINNSTTPLYRPHRNEFCDRNNNSVKFHELEIIKIPSVDGDIAVAGWALHHEYSGALPKAFGIKGLRARAGNIQVGGDNIFEDIYPELRFNSWTVSELHILDKNIIPNGRRDNFEQNAHFSNLTNQLLPHGRKIADKCRKSSIARNKIKKFESKNELIKEHLKLIKSGNISKRNKKRLEEHIFDNLQIMKSAITYEHIDRKVKIQYTKKLNRLINTIKNNLDKHKIEDDSDKLAFLSPAKSIIYRNIFDMLYEFSVNRVVAERLIKKIIVRIKRDNNKI